MAINGYDEPKDEVQEFAEKGKLKHPILLMGSKVAEDLFAVKGFPTTLWINHEGRIVRRTIGFAPDHYPAMEKQAERLLAAREKARKK